MESCLACDPSAGRRDLPGGQIAQTPCWEVEHCVGPLGLGTLIVKPKRHVVHVWELREEEASKLGPLLRRSSTALARLLGPQQIYVSLWSHSGGVPVHIHWVVQPVGAERPGGLLGPHLQAAMFDRDVLPDRSEVEAVSERLRELLASDEARPA